jgi:hypothetical protein
MGRTLARQALVLASVALLVTAGHRSAAAQSASHSRSDWEFVVSSGTVIPTGPQRDAIRRANLTAAQLTFVPRPALALTSTLGWARSRDLRLAGNPQLDLFLYDMGAEARAPRWRAGRSIHFGAFAGLGAGARSDHYRHLDAGATHHLAGYGSVGGEAGMGRARLRLEARQYFSGFTPLPPGGRRRTRSDVALLAGLRLVAR